jgi:hypothetical protein
MLSIHPLLRVACRLQKVWTAWLAQNANLEGPALHQLTACQRAFRQAQRRLTLANAHGLELIVPGLRQNLGARAKDVGEALYRLNFQLQQPAPAVPSLPFFVAELRQVDDDFHGLRIAWKQKAICATTEAITLRGVDLGRFEIQLYWDRLLDIPGERCFGIVALEPNPSAANDAVTHPHVKDESLCAGKATVALLKALEQGRIADAFCLVRSVLTHYNPSSPHVSLEAWGGLECADCPRSINGDEAWSCEGCGHDLCEDCRAECTVCTSIRCSACLNPCLVCGEACCRNCLKSSDGSKRHCCANCLVACEVCGAQVASDELADHVSKCPISPPQPGTPVNPLISPNLDSSSETLDEPPTLIAAAS